MFGLEYSWGKNVESGQGYQREAGIRMGVSRGDVNMIFEWNGLIMHSENQCKMNFYKPMHGKLI